MAKEDDDLTRELMARYGMEPEKKAPAPKPAVSAEPAAPAVEAVVEAEPEITNPFVALEEQQAAEAAKAPVQNVMQRNPTATAVGAALGAAAKYKGVGQNLLRPDPNLFRAKPVVSQVAPAAPMSNVEHTLQSAQGERPGVTGRQREAAHNWESNRQSLTQQAYEKAFPLTSKLESPIVQAGVMAPTESGIAIPKNVAVQMEQELAAKRAAEALAREQLLAREAALAKRQALVSGAGRGLARMGQGVVGGALAAPQLMEYGRDVANQRPADQTQLASAVGALMMALGRGRTGAVGGLAQIPYAVKHRQELARSMNLSDINPTAFMGMPEELSPAFRDLQPRRPEVTDMPPPTVPYGLR